VQAHPGQAARLYGAVQTALERRLGALDGASVLELYAGSGALALRLARAGADVTAVESFEPAAKALARAADAQGLRLRALAVDAEAALESAELRPRAIVLDPPRRGLSPAVRRALAALQPAVTAYVSCSPATLARDLAHLRRLGLGVESVTPFDMIPLSDAVEALAVLVPQAIPPVRILHDEDDFVAVDKPPFLPTTPQGEHQDSLLARVRALPGLARAAPIHRLDAGTSGVCLFARAPDRVEAVAQALANGTKTYVALLRGIVRAKGSIRRPLRDGAARRDAQTRYRRERVAGTHSLVHAQPEQGRQHQIRRHFSGLGHPVLGDERYGHAASNRYFAEKHGLDRPFLHAAEVELAFPDRSTRIHAPLAPDLAAVLASLEKE
ncbi:MAG TPA: pseudouridine synthase, partial [Polyangiaceae bacterium]